LNYYYGKGFKAPKYSKLLCGSSLICNALVHMVKSPASGF
jgi:hypothetical protein